MASTGAVDATGSSAPSDKTVAATIATAVGLIVVWALQTYAHTDIPAPVAGAGVTLLTLAVGYFVPENRPSTSARVALGLAQPPA